MFEVIFTKNLMTLSRHTQEKTELKSIQTDQKDEDITLKVWSYNKVVKFSSKIITTKVKICAKHQAPSDEPTGELNNPKNTLTKGYR
jgi:hypothetical protein